MRSKYKIFLLLLLVSISIRTVAQGTQEDVLNKAAELYSNGKYKEALDEWMSIYNTGLHSGILDYNIGNASFKQNNIPGAILFYERALLLKPGDEDIQYNLQIAKTLVVDKFIEIPDLFFIRWYNFISYN